MVESETILIISCNNLKKNVIMRTLGGDPNSDEVNLLLKSQLQACLDGAMEIKANCQICPGPDICGIAYLAILASKGNNADYRAILNLFTKGNISLPLEPQRLPSGDLLLSDPSLTE